MKTVLIAATIVAASFALGQKPAVPAPKTIKCPVMKGNSVNIVNATKAKMYADYKGRRYFFCCPGCPGAFKANPAKFAKSASIKIPKKTG